MEIETIIQVSFLPKEYRLCRRFIIIQREIYSFFLLGASASNSSTKTENSANNPHETAGNDH